MLPRVCCAKQFEEGDEDEDEYFDDETGLYDLPIGGEWVLQQPPGRAGGRGESAAACPPDSICLALTLAGGCSVAPCMADCLFGLGCGSLTNPCRCSRLNADGIAAPLLLCAGNLQLANFGSADMEQLLQGANLQELTLGNQLLMPGGMDTAMAGPQSTLLRLLDSPAFLEQVAAGMQALQSGEEQQQQQQGGVQQQQQQPDQQHNDGGSSSS